MSAPETGYPFISEVTLIFSFPMEEGIVNLPGAMFCHCQYMRENSDCEKTKIFIYYIWIRKKCRPDRLMKNTAGVLPYE